MAKNAKIESTIFEPFGQFPLEKDNGWLDHSREAWNRFWDRVEEQTDEDLRNCVGCYIFSINTTPWYVGMTERSFFDECWTPHKLLLYGQALRHRKRGIASLFFLVKTTPAGNFCRPGNHADIKFLERLLIDQALSVNSNLLNRKNTKHLRTIRVPGFMGDAPGRPSKDAQTLAKLLDT